ncbi:Putative AC transposase, partial [Linum grandiflorum]
MCCAAHILNLVVRDGSDFIKDEINLIRESVVYWNSTPKRVQIFFETIKQCRIISEKKLALDCPTRWNSTYNMLSVALPYKDVLFCLRQRDIQHTSIPSKAQWEFASIVVEKLRFFDEMTKVFSGTNYPTTNMFFTKICDLRYQLINWYADSNSLIFVM